jgi:hypothetical protein
MDWQNNTKFDYILSIVGAEEHLAKSRLTPPFFIARILGGME